MLDGYHYQESALEQARKKGNMTEWQVLAVIITLFGFGVSVITPIIKLNTTITKLNVTIDILNKTVEDSATKLEDHEHRITVLEQKN